MLGKENIVRQSSADRGSSLEDRIPEDMRKTVKEIVEGLRKGNHEILEKKVTVTEEGRILIPHKDPNGKERVVDLGLNE